MAKVIAVVGVLYLFVKRRLPEFRIKACPHEPVVGNVERIVHQPHCDQTAEQLTGGSRKFLPYFRDEA